MAVDEREQPSILGVLSSALAALVACGSDPPNDAGASGGPRTTSVTSGSETVSAETEAAGSADTGTGAVDEAYCQQFTAERDCASAVDATAPHQCLFYDAGVSGALLRDTPDGLKCEAYPNESYLPGCHAVEYVPWACDLVAPSEGSDACSETSDLPFDYWAITEPGVVKAFDDVPCHLRPLGAEICWDNPAPACWCRCHPFLCDSPWCVGDESSGSGSDSTGG
ncbi:MAG: hypothetical protein IAG13_08515 [Deltaproteobacteria bacterium]|nr:hypothetical protein [Nannocystaceae bacterium]